METAKSLIKDILQEIFVQAQEQNVQPPDFQTALRYTNRYMQQLDARGVKLGWTNLTKESDAVTIPDGAILGVVYNVALQLCNQYDFEPSAALVINARDSMGVMRLLGVKIPKSNFPSTLPVGSGNEQDYSDSFHFYSGCCEDKDKCGEDC